MGMSLGLRFCNHTTLSNTHNGVKHLKEERTEKVEPHKSGDL
jgi:hypothetical protein